VRVRVCEHGCLKVKKALEKYICRGMKWVEMVEFCGQSLYLGFHYNRLSYTAHPFTSQEYTCC
jgi:hypothetical protein